MLALGLETNEGDEDGMDDADWKFINGKPVDGDMALGKTDVGFEKKEPIAPFCKFVFAIEETGDRCNNDDVEADAKFESSDAVFKKLGEIMAGVPLSE